MVQPFDLAYAATAAADFVARDLAGALGVRDVVVGWDFTAGHERARVEALRPLLQARGLALHVVEPVAEAGLTVSSTKIREFLLEGQVEAAALLLTRPHDVDGRVVPGAGRGRGLGFATANVATELLLPGNGVYAVRAWVRPAGAGGLAPPRRGLQRGRQADRRGRRPHRRRGPPLRPRRAPTSTARPSGSPSRPACATSGASPRWRP